MKQKKTGRKRDRRRIGAGATAVAAAAAKEWHVGQAIPEVEMEEKEGKRAAENRRKRRRTTGSSSGTGRDQVKRKSSKTPPEVVVCPEFEPPPLPRARLTTKEARPGPGLGPKPLPRQRAPSENAEQGEEAESDEYDPRVQREELRGLTQEVRDFCAQRGRMRKGRGRAKRGGSGHSKAALDHALTTLGLTVKQEHMPYKMYKGLNQSRKEHARKAAEHFRRAGAVVPQHIQEQLGTAAASSSSGGKGSRGARRRGGGASGAAGGGGGGGTGRAAGVGTLRNGVLDVSHLLQPS